MIVIIFSAIPSVPVYLRLDVFIRLHSRFVFVPIRGLELRLLNLGVCELPMEAMSDAEAEASVTRLVIYPVKGLGGQQLEEVEVKDRGFAWDRRWMLVGDDHRFLSQRQVPKMATIKAAVTGEGLELSHGNSQITVPLKPPEIAPKIEVTIWNDRVEAVFLPEYGEWFSEALHHRCDLVFMPETTLRAVNPAFARPGDIVGFADAYPVLLIGEASLADLNARLEDPVPIDRFRPNIFVSTQEPFIEDRWAEMEIGSALLCGTKASDRCSVPTINQRTGEPAGPEPIRTLASYRRFDNGVYLGQNLTIRRMGWIALGNVVSVRSKIAAVYA